MKNVFLGLALCLTAACASEQKASVADDTQPGAGACATECASTCDEAAKAECSSKKSECSSEKKVCPITGKEYN